MEILEIIGSLIRHYIFNVPYKKRSKKKSDDWYGGDEYNDLFVGLAAVIAVVCLCGLIFY
nr:hypothetical protein [uncultured Mucilaginibacter sp.]